MDVPDMRPDLWQLDAEGSFCVTIFIIVTYIIFIASQKRSTCVRKGLLSTMGTNIVLFPHPVSKLTRNASVMNMLTIFPLKHWLLFGWFTKKNKNWKRSRMHKTLWKVLITACQARPITRRVQRIVQVLSFINWKRLSSHSSKIVPCGTFTPGSIFQEK